MGIRINRNFAIRRVTLSACLFLMLLCQPYRMLDSFKLTTCLNFWYHQLLFLLKNSISSRQVHVMATYVLKAFFSASKINSMS